MEECFLGIDVGSTTVKLALINRTTELRARRYLRSNGRPRQTLIAGLREINAQINLQSVIGIGTTGSGGEAIAGLIGCRHTNELVAQTRAVAQFYPQARTVIEIGGQDSKFLVLNRDEAADRLVLADFAMNALCAAGTGSFLDQQAERLGIAIEQEFAQIALQSSNPARIAGRCTVFAKSDMIHLQQQGVPLPDILAGLCLALARNFKSVVAKGKRFAPPILFQGGVAYNQAVVRAFEMLLELGPDELIIPQHHEMMAALGTALTAYDDQAAGVPGARLDLAHLVDDLERAAPPVRYLPPLTLNGDTAQTIPLKPLNRQREAFLGIDVGSISTNLVLIDASGSVLTRRYLFTAGRPLQAVRRGLHEIAGEVGDLVTVRGVGVTGSGRYLTADFVGADVVRNEISAQARAAVAIDPQVDTIFEIGGQDSKYIRLNNGVVVDFAMNNACAAGTGAFLEEQAERLKISVRADFGRLACACQTPVCLGERCTVFMESDLVHHQQRGATQEELTAGLAYAVVQNYLNRVVQKRPLGKRIFFQGGVAWNQAVLAAFRQQTGRTIIVPPHHDVTGAIGAALLAQEEMYSRSERGAATETRFRGFELQIRDYDSETFECKACPNLCAISKIRIAGEPPIFYGALCDRFEEAGRSRVVATASLPDLFAERHALLMADYTPPEGPCRGRMRVAMPRALLFYDMFPYWRRFFESLEIELLLSAPTNPPIVAQSLEHALAETCFPAKLYYGHVFSLLDTEVDALFLPSVMNRSEIPLNQSESNYCPYIPAVAYMAAGRIDLQKRSWRAITGAIRFMNPAFKQHDLAALAAQLGVTKREIMAADAAGTAAQQRFYTVVRARGQDALAGLAADQHAVVLIGHPYNIHDPQACRNLPQKLRKLGVLPIPYDYLPLEGVDISDQYPQMYWRGGQEILAAAKMIRADPRLHAIYVSNFSCGPDSFVLGYFQRLMGDKPFLELELDEHSADAGVMTRCEAFLDSIKNRPLRECVVGD